MLKLSIEFELRKQYNLGNRQFPKINLRHAELRTIKLTQADLKGADLSFANLKDADLSYCDLSGAYLHETNLMGANLTSAKLEGASLTKAILTKANLTKANLNKALLNNCFLTNVTLREADLRDAYLSTADLKGAILEGAVYNSKTLFPPKFDPGQVGMVKDGSVQNLYKQKITVLQLLNSFNQLIACSNHYLGNTLTVKYLEVSRPAKADWLKKFNISPAGEISFAGVATVLVTQSQLQWFSRWIKAFIKSCSLIIQDFNSVIQHQENLILNLLLNVDLQ